MATIYFGGHIYPMDTPERVEALAVEDGRVLAAGDLAPLRAQYPGAKEADLEGRTLIPAFLDAHSHLSGLANSLLQADLTGAGDMAAVVDVLQAFSKTAGRGGWVVGGGVHFTLSEDMRPALDEAFPDRPVMAVHQSSHGGLFNAAALRALGLPEGRGCLVENEFLAAQRRVPPAALEDLLDAFVRAQDLYLSQGVVLAQEGYMSRDLAGLYQLLIQRDLLKMEVVGYFAPDCLDLIPSFLKKKNFRVGGCKILTDGSPQQMTAWVTQPYLPGGCGQPNMTEEAELQAVQFAGAMGLQLLAHCNGDAAIDRFIRCLDQAKYPAALRPVLIHGQLLRRDQLPELKRLGVTASLYVSHVYHWGEIHVANLGPERAGRISPAASVLEAGVPLTFHMDTPVLPQRPLDAVQCAVERRTSAGRLLGEEERISPYEALRAVTSTVAWQYHQENERGTLTPGKRADLAVLSGDPMEGSLGTIRVEKTIRA